MNPIYKEKVKQDPNKMLQLGKTEPMEESEWISLMVAQNETIVEKKITWNSEKEVVHV